MTDTHHLLDKKQPKGITFAYFRQHLIHNFRIDAEHEIVLIWPTMEITFNIKVIKSLSHRMKRVIKKEYNTKPKKLLHRDADPQTLHYNAFLINSSLIEYKQKYPDQSQWCCCWFL